MTELWGLVAVATIVAWDERWAEVLAFVQQARTVSAPLADSWWDGAVFRSGTYLSVYEAAAVALTDGWAAAAERWADAIERAEQDGDVPAVRLTITAASAVARRCDRSDLADVIAAAMPPGPDLDVVPFPFVAAPVVRGDEPLTALLRAAVAHLRVPLGGRGAPTACR